MSILRHALRAGPAGSSIRLFSSTAQARVAKLTIVGRVVARPELSTLASGQELLRYTLATNHGAGDNRKTSWWNVSSFPPEKLRDRMLRLGKGSLVYVEGEASMRRFENKEGKTTSALSIVQRKIETLERREAEEEEGQEGHEGQEGQEQTYQEREDER